MSNLYDAKSGLLSGLLPGGAFRDGNSLVRDVVVAEMTGVEEDLMAAKGPIEPRVNQVMVNCIKSLGDVTDKQKIHREVSQMLQADRTYLMMLIRRATYGDDLFYSVSCKCGALNKAKLDLSKLETTSMPDPHKLSYVTEIGGVSCRWHAMNAADERWLMAHQEKLKTQGRAGEDQLTLSLLCRVDALGDVQFNRETDLKTALLAMKQLPLRHRSALRSSFRENEAWVDTEATIECINCKNDLTIDVVREEGFFYPDRVER